MIGVAIAIILQTGSICLLAGVIIFNQINPNFNTALAVPVYNAIGILLALLGLVVSVIAYQKNKELKLAKRTMVLGIVCVVVLVLLFPLSNTGSLSAFH